jgi:hypothetical protein
MNEFRNIHLLRIRILIERKIFFIAIEYFLMRLVADRSLLQRAKH